MALKRMTDTRPLLQKEAAMSRRAWMLWEALTWVWVERHLVQILVVVANSQLETLAAEVEKGSLRTVIGQGLLGPKSLVKSI